MMGLDFGSCWTRMCILLLTLLVVSQKTFANTENEDGHGHWGPWSAMSECSATCGSGTQEVTRVYIPGPNDREMKEEFRGTSIFTCTNPNFPECPTDGTWSGWGAWTSCTKGCGGGDRRRKRDCLGMTPGGKECEGDKTQEEKCNKDPCPRLPPHFDMSKCGLASENFTCSSGKMCIAANQKCDSTVQCHDGSDEMDCPVQVRYGGVRYDLRNDATSLLKPSVSFRFIVLVVGIIFFITSDVAR